MWNRHLSFVRATNGLGVGSDRTDGIDSLSTAWSLVAELGVHESVQSLRVLALEKLVLLVMRRVVASASVDLGVLSRRLNRPFLNRRIAFYLLLVVQVFHLLLCRLSVPIAAFQEGPEFVSHASSTNRAMRADKRTVLAD